MDARRSGHDHGSRLVYERSQENVERLTAALLEFGAIYRHQFDRRIPPDAAGFLATSGGGHHLFATSAGDVDALRSSGARGFAELAPSAVRYAIEGVEARFASLQDVIQMKTEAGRDKDRAVLPILRATLAEQDG